MAKVDDNRVCLPDDDGGGARVAVVAVDQYDAASGRSCLVDELERVGEMVHYRRGRHVRDGDALVDVLAGKQVGHLVSHVQNVRHSAVSQAAKVVRHFL